MRARLVTSLLCASFLAAAWACDDAAECPGVYLSPQLTLILERAEWAPAEYRVEFEGDEYALRCSVRVPVLELAEDDAGVHFELTGDDDVTDGGMQPPFIACEEPPERAPGLRASIGRAIVFTIYDAPAQLKVMVSSEGRERFEVELEPDYETYRPLGTQCDGVDEAVERVTLP